MRTNLLSLQNTQSLMDTTQERLSTGLKVNSAIDNASSYYTAQSLNNRASDLSALLDSMGQGIQTIQAANEGIEAITEFVEQAKAIANSARDAASKTDVKTLNAKFSDLTTPQTPKTSAATALTLEIKKVNGDKVEALGSSDEHDKAVTVALAKLNAKLAAGELSGKDASAFKAAADAAMKEFTGTVLEDVMEFSISADGKVSLTAKAGYQIAAKGAGEFAGQGDKAADTGLAGDTATSTVNVNTDRQKYAEQFNEIMRQIDKLAKDSGYKGINLLQMNTLTVIFNEDRSSQIEVKGVDASSTGLKISNPVDSWQTDEDINKSITEAENAISELRIMASDYGNYYSIVQNRQDFTKNLINVLTEGADNLTLADMNEESANMLALQTRQQLAINSLSLASQAAQGVLQLF
ncbi:MAG: flagellin [Alphaproteobacteria bacterium]